MSPVCSARDVSKQVDKRVSLCYTLVVNTRKKIGEIIIETTIYQPSDAPHILLTSLGMRAIKTTYKLDKKTVTTKLTPLALVQLLEESQLPNRVVAVATQGAKRETWQLFRSGICRTLKFSPELVEIPDGNNPDEIRQILESVANRIPEGADLTLDVTQGFRHFPFIFYALVLYLTSLRGVKIRGAYYGMIEGTPQGAPKPIIDLQPLLELPEWFHAVRMFRDYGTTKPIADRLQPLADTLKQETEQLFKVGNEEAGKEHSRRAKPVKNSVDQLKQYAFAYESALPLELGKASKMLVNSVQELPVTANSGLPLLLTELIKTVVDAAEESAFEKPPNKDGNWKAVIHLDKDELERQARMIDLYLDRGQLSLATGLMREWVVSWAIWKSSETEEYKDWLNGKVRQRYEHRLGALGAFARNDEFRSNITPEQQEFGTFWNQLTNDLRNFLHHHAMRIEALEQPPSPLENVRHFWNELKKDCIDMPLLGGGGGKLLISPHGTRPGALFSALQIAEADTCLVICSAISASSVPEAAKHANFTGCIDQIEMDDPQGGFNEIDEITQQARHYLLSTDEVVANMTGGTTLMGIVVQRLVENAQKLDRPVRRFVLIDRRRPEDQASNPFVEGDSCWLDEP